MPGTTEPNPKRSRRAAAAILIILGLIGVLAFTISRDGESPKIAAPAPPAPPIGTDVLGLQISPLLEISFPLDEHTYGVSGWNAGCSPDGICGHSLGLTGVDVAIVRHSDGFYWNGSTSTFVSAPTYNEATGSADWKYDFGLPANDGTYTVTAGSVPGVLTSAVDFTVDRTPPPAPAITGHPTDPTYDMTADFSFSDAQPNVTFRCALDGAPATACPNPTHLSGLTLGDHTLSVNAVDPAGNVGPAASFSWTVLTTTQFTVAGSPSQKFRPGISQSVDLSISNPFNFDLKVTAVTVHVGPASLPACAGGNLIVTQDYSGTVVVPAHATRSLSSLSVPEPAWPVLTMPNTASNQDACQNATFHLTYTGTGSMTS